MASLSCTKTALLSDPSCHSKGLHRTDWLSGCSGVSSSWPPSQTPRSLRQHNSWRNSKGTWRSRQLSCYYKANTIKTENRLRQAQVLQLLKLSLRTYFTFDGTIYEQVKNTPMGSPISGFIAEAVLQRLESQIFQHHRPKFRARYVDDTFVVINRDQLLTFKERLNAVFTDIQFTMEEEENNQLTFLDVLECRKDCGGLKVKVFRKATNTMQDTVQNSLKRIQTKPVSYRTDLLEKEQRIEDQLPIKPTAPFSSRLSTTNIHDLFFADDRAVNTVSEADIQRSMGLFAAGVPTLYSYKTQVTHDANSQPISACSRRQKMPRVRIDPIRHLWTQYINSTDPTVVSLSPPCSNTHVVHYNDPAHREWSTSPCGTAVCRCSLQHSCHNSRDEDHRQSFSLHNWK
nr:unnamed protein product [Spirometra erinaceieuropaei]